MAGCARWPPATERPSELAAHAVGPYKSPEPDRHFAFVDLPFYTDVVFNWDLRARVLWRSAPPNMPKPSKYIAAMPGSGTTLAVSCLLYTSDAADE